MSNVIPISRISQCGRDQAPFPTRLSPSLPLRLSSPDLSVRSVQTVWEMPKSNWELSCNQIWYESGHVEEVLWVPFCCTAGPTISRSCVPQTMASCPQHCATGNTGTHLLNSWAVSWALLSWALMPSQGMSRSRSVSGSEWFSIKMNTCSSLYEDNFLVRLVLVLWAYLPLLIPSQRHCTVARATYIKNKTSEKKATKIKETKEEEEKTEHRFVAAPAQSVKFMRPTRSATTHTTTTQAEVAVTVAAASTTTTTTGDASPSPFEVLVASRSWSRNWGWSCKMEGEDEDEDDAAQPANFISRNKSMTDLCTAQSLQITNVYWMSLLCSRSFLFPSPPSLSLPLQQEWKSDSGCCCCCCLKVCSRLSASISASSLASAAAELHLN